MKKIILILVFLLSLTWSFFDKSSGTLFAQNGGTNGWYYGTFYVEPNGHVVFYCPCYVTVERCRVSIPKPKGETIE